MHRAVNLAQLLILAFIICKNILNQLKHLTVGVLKNHVLNTRAHTGTHACTGMHAHIYFICLVYAGSAVYFVYAVQMNNFCIHAMTQRCLPGVLPH